jgi:hAT family C-terminal dimerisation region
MAMDYLPVQGSAVPCERIFSSSAETDTKKRNRIKPLLMEALQMLKFYRRKSLDFTTGLVLEEEDMEEDDPEDLLAELLASHQNRAQQSLDRILTSLKDHGEAPEDGWDKGLDSGCEGDSEDGEDGEDGENGEDGEGSLSEGSTDGGGGI